MDDAASDIQLLGHQRVGAEPCVVDAAARGFVAIETRQAGGGRVQFMPGVGPRLIKLSSRKRRKPCRNEKSIGPTLPSAPTRKSLARDLSCDSRLNSFPPAW